MMSDILTKMDAIKAKKFNIDATRGKPCFEIVAKCDNLINAPLENFIAENGTDVRNYGGADGLPEMKRLFAQLLDVKLEEIIVGGNSSLSMMYDCIATLILSGQWGNTHICCQNLLTHNGVQKPRRTIKFICPAPGYDRHFAICEYFGIEMLTVTMTPNGPDMDEVEALAKDENVAGMWCVPVFSNPQGYVYSDDTIRRLATMKTAHPHFKILWDNAYSVHVFNGARPKTINLMDECRKNGNEARPIMFASFSKISVAGAAIACMAVAGDSGTVLRDRLSVQTIGPDKVNQLRHVRFFKDINGIESHMKKIAEILRPKFEKTCDYMEKHLAGTGATFTKPRGGYFVSVETPLGCAKLTRELCKEMGVLITEAGATFPYGKDPADTNLRFAPTFLSMEELEIALEVFCLAVNIAVGK